MTKTMKGFNFSIAADIWLRVEDIWPDGDAPENPTVADVLAVIAKCGGTERVLRDWDLDHELVLTVSDDKHSEEAP